MKKKSNLLSVVLVILFTVGFHSTVFGFEMSDYWSLKKGDIFVYDRDFSTITNETRVFGSYTGRQFIDRATFCDSHSYIYDGNEGILMVGIYDNESETYIDLSSTPVKLADKNMDIGDSVVTNIPAGVLDSSEITITITLETLETVVVPAGTFNNSIRVRINIIDGPGQSYVERIWLAKDVGPVQMHRVSEVNTNGCFFTCGSFSCCCDYVIQERYIKLKSYLKAYAQKKVVVIPLY